MHQVIREWRFAGTMLLVVSIIACLAYLDAARESRQALDEFAAEQDTLLATSLSLVRGTPEWAANPRAALQRMGEALEQSAPSRLLISADGRLITRDDKAVDDPAVLEAAGERSFTLKGPSAQALGLPPRMAVGVRHTITTEGGGSVQVVLVTSAAKLRDRERWAQWRLLVSLLGGGSIVLGFGLVSLRRLRKQLGLEHQLHLAEVSRKNEQQLALADKLATAGALATGIAHEVSTPLSVIVARAEQLKAWAADNPKAARGVETVLQQAERIGAIVRGLLGLIRGEAAGFREVDPKVFLDEVRGLVEHRFERAQVRLEVVASSGSKLLCDPLLLSQALVNLLLNACQACSAGGNVRLEARGVAGKLEISVTDDGAGISEAVAAQATEPLFTTKPPGTGTGLGLAIASEIVKHHRGTLVLAPRKDAKGTRVTVTVPLATEPSHAAA